MPWNDPIPKQPARALEVWSTNEEIWAAWGNYVNKRGAKNTQRNLLTYAGVFVRSFNTLVTELGPEDIEAFIERIETKCSKLMNAKHPQCLAKEDVAFCPVLLGNQPYTACPSYRPLLPSATWSYVCAIHRFYAWLVTEGRMPRNPAAMAMPDFALRHEAFFADRRRKPKRRILAVNEVQRLITHTPLRFGIAILLMAKCFLRLHEVLKITWDPAYCNLDEGWIDLPPNHELGGKRMGNTRIILDAEARHWIRRYREWWLDKVKRDVDGNPITDRIILTQLGMPWGSNAVQNFNSALHRHSIRIRLMNGNETERAERVNSHCFRAFATTSARNSGASIADVQIMRGDLSPGSIIRYDDYLSRLPELYVKYGPKLGL